MDCTRRLSLTLLLVPIIAARRLSAQDLGLPSGQGEVSQVGDWGTTETPDYDTEVYDEGTFGDLGGSWLRRKRALDNPGGADDLETAEQVVFRPTFRYKQVVKKREQSHRLREELRRLSHQSPVAESSSHSVATLPASPSVQRKYYAYSHTSPVAASSSVAALPASPTGQRKYYTYTPQSQRVYTPRPVQRVYSPSPAQGYSPLSPQSNYQRLAQSAFQYPRNILFTQNNQGYRPQRSPYAYLYSQRY